eukprot:8516247-Ditylum_brightwellii.AAC.1
MQFVPTDTSKKLDKKGQRIVQSIVGMLLYYACAIDNPVLVALNNIGAQQSAPTENTHKATVWLMDFFHTYPNAKLQFFVDDMQFCIDLNAAYLVMSGTK